MSDKEPTLGGDVFEGQTKVDELAHGNDAGCERVHSAECPGRPPLDGAKDDFQGLEGVNSREVQGNLIPDRNKGS